MVYFGRLQISVMDGLVYIICSLLFQVLKNMLCFEVVSPLF